MGQNRSQMATTYREAYCRSRAGVVMHSVAYTYAPMFRLFIAALTFRQPYVSTLRVLWPHDSSLG